VIVAKFSEHLPLYRQSQFFARHGVTLGRSTLAALGGLLTAALSGSDRAACWRAPSAVF